MGINAPIFLRHSLRQSIIFVCEPRNRSSDKENLECADLHRNVWQHQSLIRIIRRFECNEAQHYDSNRPIPSIQTCKYPSEPLAFFRLESLAGFKSEWVSGLIEIRSVCSAKVFRKMPSLFFLIQHPSVQGLHV